jgi:hypothetical protein
MKGLYKLAIKTSIAVCVFILTVGFLSVAPAYAADVCSFDTSQAYFDSTGNPGEELSFQWDKDSGNVKAFSWKTSIPRFSFKGDPGQVTTEGVYYSFNLGATTENFQTTSRETIKGYLSPRNVINSRDEYTFAGIFEGTGTAWFVAYGTVSPESCLLTPPSGT